LLDSIDPQLFTQFTNAVASTQVIDKVVADRDQLQDQLPHSIITVEQLHHSFQDLAPLLPEISKSAATFRTIQHKVDQQLMKPTADTPGAIISPTLLATDIQDTSDDVSRAAAAGTSISPVASKEEAIITPEAAPAAGSTPAKPLAGAATQPMQAAPAELQSPQESPYAADAEASSPAESCGSNSRCAASPLSSAGAKDTASEQLLVSPSNSSISRLQKIATTRGLPAAAAADGSACRAPARRSPSKPSSSTAAAAPTPAAGASPDQTSPRLMSSRAASRMSGAAQAAASRMMSPAAHLSFVSDCWPSPAEQKTPPTQPCNGNDITGQLDIAPAELLTSVSINIAATGPASGGSPASVCEPAKLAFEAVKSAAADIRAAAAASDHSARLSTSSVDAVADVSSDVMPAAGTAAGSEATQDDAASAEVISKPGSQPAHSTPPRQQAQMQQKLGDISAGKMPPASASPEESSSRAAKRRNAAGNHSTDFSPQHSKKVRTAATSSATHVHAPLLQQQAEVASAAATATPSSGARKTTKMPRARHSPVGVNAAEAAAALAAASAAIQKIESTPSQVRKSSPAATAATSPPASASMLKPAAASMAFPAATSRSATSLAPVSVPQAASAVAAKDAPVPSRQASTSSQSPSGPAYALQQQHAARSTGGAAADARQAKVPQDCMGSGSKAEMQLPPAASSSADMPSAFKEADAQAEADIQRQKVSEIVTSKNAADAVTAGAGQVSAAGVKPGAATGKAAQGPTSASAGSGTAFSDVSKAAGVTVVGDQPQGASSAAPSSARSWAQVVRRDRQSQLPNALRSC
jgi:hypothetical protein